MSAQIAEWTETGLWLAVIASGVYHGVNPGMGWPLAVSAGLMGRGRRDLIASLGPLGAGHFLAMVGIGLGIAGVCQRNRKAIFGIIGLVFNGLIILGGGCLVLIGMASGPF